jgi:hypothetical protein
MLDYLAMEIYCLHPLDITDEELQLVEDAGIPHGTTLSDAPPGSVVLPRYRALPFGRELEQEAQRHGLSLLNPYSQHAWAADIHQWYPALRGLTPETWRRVEDIPHDVNGPFFLKGATNSLKHKPEKFWYAETRSEIGEVIANLHQDSLIGQQQLAIRQWIELEKVEDNLVGVPQSREYRCFSCLGAPLAIGDYWEPSDKEAHEFLLDHASFVLKINRIVGKFLNFAALDFGVLENGDPIVIEVNDGSMAGLCGVNGGFLYMNLRSKLMYL